MFITKKELEELRGRGEWLTCEVVKLQARVGVTERAIKKIGEGLTGSRFVNSYDLEYSESYDRVLDTEARVNAILDHLNLDAFNLPAEPPKTVLRKREKK